MEGKKIYIETYGCAANRADTESISGILKESGFEIVRRESDSDLNLINTCIVKTPTEQRMRRRIQDLSKKEKPLVVAGCMPKVFQRTIEKINPKASLLGTDSIFRVADVARDAIVGKRRMFLNDKDVRTEFPKLRMNDNVGIVKISKGCLGNCSYCITKFSRGMLKSYGLKDILREVSKSVKDGCNEIQLASEDNGCYGIDIGTNISELIKEVCDVEGDFVIKVGMMNPLYIKRDETLSDLIESFKHGKVKKFVHIPVQSGSNNILKVMKRGYTVEEFEKIVEKFRNEIPEIYINTDVIVGFPGETEKDFQLTVDLVKRVKFGNVNVSRFGSRPGTEASKMRQLSKETIIERSRMLHDIISSS